MYSLLLTPVTADFRRSCLGFQLRPFVKYPNSKHLSSPLSHLRRQKVFPSPYIGSNIPPDEKRPKRLATLETRIHAYVAVVNLHLDMLSLLDNQLVQILERLGPFGVLGLPILLLASSGRHDHDHTRRPLGASSSSQFRAAGQKHIRDVVLFAQDGDVRYDVHGADVCRNDYDTGRESGGDWVRGRGLAYGFNDFFDAALEAFLLCGYKGKKEEYVSIFSCGGGGGSGVNGGVKTYLS